MPVAGTRAGDGNRTHVSRPALTAGSVTYEERRSRVWLACKIRSPNVQAAVNRALATWLRYICGLASQRYWLYCMASQLAGDRSRHFDSRNANSGLTPLAPISTRFGAGGATPSLVACSRRLRLLGSRYTAEMNWSGCGGCAWSSVVVLIVEHVRLPVANFQYQLPVAVDPDRPQPPVGALQRVQTEPRAESTAASCIFRRRPAGRARAHAA